MKTKLKANLERSLLACLAVCIPCVASAQFDHVFHISIDGLRSDTVQSLIAEDSASMTNFMRLANEGASTFQARSDFSVTQTIANHGSMLTGLPAERPVGQSDSSYHGYTNNRPAVGDTIHDDGNPNLDYVYSTFDVVHDHGMSTGFYAGKTRLDIYSRSWNGDNGAMDEIGEDNGRAKIDQTVIMNSDTRGILDALKSDILTTPYNYVLLHITDPDGAGHSSQFGSAIYEDAIRQTDAYLGEVFEIIDTNPEYTGRTGIVVTSDHGGGDPENNHLEASNILNYQIPFYIWEPDMTGGLDAYDLFMNRINPGDANVDYNDPQQPLWSGDSGNIALGMLGLPSIPGSTLIPVVPEPSGIALLGAAMLVGAGLRRAGLRTAGRDDKR